MARKEDKESKTIAKRLAVFILTFYAFYYLVSAILTAAFDSSWSGAEGFGTYPFEHDKDLFNPGKGDAALGRWLAMLLTYATALVVNFFYVRTTRMTWDYACTTSLFHFVLSCIVTLSFPVNWIWWLTIIIVTLLLWAVGDYTVYKFHDMRDIQLDNA